MVRRSDSPRSIIPQGIFPFENQGLYPSAPQAEIRIERGRGEAQRRRWTFYEAINIERPIVEWLLNKGYDVKWIPDIDCEMEDDELLDLTIAEKRVLLTNDKDFGAMTFRQRKISTGIILFRIKGQDTGQKIKVLQTLLDKVGDKIIGNFVVLAKKKGRIIPIEEGPWKKESF